LHRRPLDLGEIADLRLGEFDVVDRLRGDLGDKRVDLAFGEAKAWRRPFVKALAEFAHRHVTALGDIGNYPLDGAADLGVGLFLLAAERRLFDVSWHISSYSITSSASASR